MSSKLFDSLLASLFAGLLLWLLVHRQPAAEPAPAPAPQPVIVPVPTPMPSPPSPDEAKRRRHPLRPWLEAESGRDLIKAVSVGGPVAPDGKTEVTCDLPFEVRLKNVGGVDGAGLCVFSSVAMAARWQHETRLEDFQKFMRQKPGGGYPSKVDKMIAEYAPSMVKGKDYIQYEGNDLDVLWAVLQTGRMPSVTYNGRDPQYRGQTVAHMVNLVHLDQEWACVLDNNFVGEQELKWMPVEDFKARWTGGRQGWMVALLAPPPPPVPRNTP